VTAVLPAPHLDDRTFQDLVDDARRLIHRRCPEWSDHNVSDPGITLIEAFAQMVDQLIYRLNRVPDRNYVKFLDLLGVELRPSAAARGEVTFWLSAPQPQTVLVRAETEVATPRTDVEEATVFTTTEDLHIVPSALTHAGSAPAGGDPADHTTALQFGGGFACFSSIPIPGDSLLVGLSDAVPSCALVLRLDCSVRGVGVDPRRPPLVWEAWTPEGWVACDLDRDETGGLNRPGDVLVHVPTGHQTSVIARQRAGWLRCRLVETEPGRPTYTASPHIRQLAAFTVGGTARTVHAAVVHDEDLGESDGSPGQSFQLQRSPVIAGDRTGVLCVSGPNGVEEWTAVPHFAESSPEDHHYRVDAGRGVVEFASASTERCRRRAADCGCRSTGPVEGAAATSRPARCGCSRPACPTCPGWRTGAAPPAACPGRRSRTPRSADLCCCAPATGP
jgi:predicted phage baseplate assembly protein